MDVEWVLTSMKEIGGDETAVLESGKYTISFEPNLVIVGQCDCNDYSAEYVLSEDNSLEIRKLLNTEAACSPTTKCWDFFWKVCKARLHSRFRMTCCESTMRTNTF